MTIRKAVLQMERQIEGLRAGNSQSQIVSFAGNVRVQRTILPPLEVYQTWLAEHRAKPSAGRVRSMTQMDAKKLRRIAVMKHGGETQKAIGDAVGFTSRTVCIWLSLLPVALGGRSPA